MSGVNTAMTNTLDTLVEALEGECTFRVSRLGLPGAVGENRVLRCGDVSRAERLPASNAVGLGHGDIFLTFMPGCDGLGRENPLRSAST